MSKVEGRGGVGGTCVCIVTCWVSFVVGLGSFWLSFPSLVSFVGHLMFVVMCAVGVFSSNDVCFCRWVFGTFDISFESGTVRSFCFLLGGFPCRGRSSHRGGPWL